jgi:hypothetical protein
MMSSGPNPRALQRCLLGSAYSTCAYTPCEAAAIPTCPINHLPESRILRLPTSFRLPAHPLSNTETPTHHVPEPQTTILKTEQNPLKIDLPAKV